MLQQRGYYVIELSNGDKIQLRFCTWTFRRFCELNGNLSLNGLMAVFSNEISISQITSLLLCAAEYVKLSGKEEFKYNDFDASNWIDEMGGLAGVRFAELLKSAARSIMDTGETAEGKKKEEGQGADMGSPNGHGIGARTEAVGVG